MLGYLVSWIIASVNIIYTCSKSKNLMAADLSIKDDCSSPLSLSNSYNNYYNMKGVNYGTMLQTTLGSILRSLWWYWLPRWFQGLSHYVIKYLSILLVVMLFPDHSLVREKIWCILSDFWTLQDAACHHWWSKMVCVGRTTHLWAHKFRLNPSIPLVNYWYTKGHYPHFK